MKTCLSFIALLALTGCAATLPKPESTSPVAEITPDMARESGNVGSRVRWGGEIVEVTPKQNETCFEILSRPLSDSGRPLSTDRNFGRFLACSKEFYDPAVYVAEREVSVVGTLAGPVEGKVGERDYRFPKVQADDVYLWPRITRRYYRPYRYYDPFWDPSYGFGYSPFRRCYGCFW
ncbi:MAG: Slp family lipoprotein [Burkholderiales bacterium]